MDMDEERSRRALQDAVENAYRVFARYRPGTEVSVCRCPRCIQSDSEFELLNKPLRDVGHYALSDYVYAANNEGEPGFDPDELRYFLPRILEFIAADDAPSFSDPAVTLRRLAQCRYRDTWPSDDVAAVDRFYSALLANHLARRTSVWAGRSGEHPSSGGADILCMVVIGGGDLDRLLSEWDANREPRSAHHLAAEILSMQLSEESGTSYPGAFWDNDASAKEIFRTWLVRPDAIVQLERALAVERDAQMRGWLQTAIDEIRTR